MGLKLSDEETIRWYLPVAFAKVKPAVELLVRNVEPDGPEREQASGVAVLALASFDERGFPVVQGAAVQFRLGLRGASGWPDTRLAPISGRPGRPVPGD
ncbi:hypothetical protein FH063_003270 [Azospirillum argentinense]|uniref:Uncharacterized protein n=1 Tax=Azospirillum argentinense TaxID=2970906 RepID=A0A5B0KM15_9PROT|nr:hypothetical protein FH063_003270 [Azospirillum argentinense]